MKVKGIDLADQWTIWIDLDGKQKEFKKLVQFSTVEEFWMIFNNLRYIVKNLPQNSNMRVLRSGAPILWDGMKGEFSGGFWSLDMEKEEVNGKYLDLLVSVVAESFENHEYIVGIVLSLKEQFIQVQLWSSATPREFSFESNIRFICNLGDEENVNYTSVTTTLSDPRNLLSKEDVTKQYSASENGSYDLSIRYESSLLKKLGKEHNRIPEEIKKFNWQLSPKAKQDEEADSPAVENNRFAFRRSSWPNVFEPPQPWRSGKRASLDESTLYSQFSGLNLGVCTDESSTRFKDLPSIKASRIWDADLYESEPIIETKHDSSYIREVLQPFDDAYFMSYSDNLDKNDFKILEDEKCALCLKGSPTTWQKCSYIVLVCKMLQCRHILHANCIPVFSDRINEILSKYHSVVSVRGSYIGNEDFKVNAQDVSGKFKGSMFTFHVSHILSLVPLLKVDINHKQSSFLDSKNNSEYFMVDLMDKSCRIPFMRGKFFFKWTDPVSGNEWEKETYFDVTDLNFDKLKIVIHDEVYNRSLEIALTSDGITGLLVSKLKFIFKKPKQVQKPSGKSLPNSSLNESLEILRRGSTIIPQKEESNQISMPRRDSIGSLRLPLNFERPSALPLFEVPSALSHNAPSWEELDKSYWDEKNEMEKRNHQNEAVLETFRIDSENPPTVNSLKGKFIQISKTQPGSRFIQEKLAEMDKDSHRIIFEELKLGIADLMIDNFGHYAIQKLFEVSSDTERSTLIDNLGLNISNIACHKQGSFSLQGMMDFISELSHIERVGEFLKPNLVRVIMSASGHYVILKFLQRFVFPYTRFIHESIERNCVVLACDHYGLRVIKAVMDAGPLSELNGIFKKVARGTMKIVENQYGNYVVQQVLDVAPPSICNSIKMKMEGKFVRLAKQKFSSNVVEKCLHSSTNEWKAIIIRELCSAAGKLIRDRYGNYVLQTALSVADPLLAKEMSKSLTPHLGTLRENVKQKWMSILESNGEYFPLVRDLIDY